MLTQSDFNLRIEQLKIDQEFDSYLETLGYFLENETDEEPEKVAKLLNKKIMEEVYKEANELGMLKNQEEFISIL